VINLLYLTGSFFMMQVYDRVLPSRSVPTLVALAGLAAALYAFQGLLDLIRSRLMVRVGSSLDIGINQRVYEAIVRLPLRSQVQGDGLQAVRDLDQIRGFLSGPGPLALFDLPWLPLYIGICFIFHFWLGVAALIGAIVLVVITIMTDIKTRAPARAAAEAVGTRNAIAETGRRNAEVLQAMGMEGRTTARWADANRKYLEAQQRSSDVSGGFGALSKVFRMMLQSGVLAVGAYLVIHQEATGGIIIAGSILSARALAPVELAIANWRGFIAARQSWGRLSQLLSTLPISEDQLALPKPQNALAVEGITLTPPGQTRIVVQDLAFQLRAGQGLGVIGPSASGKSSLARALVGVWKPVQGKVRLDGAALEQWSPEALGPHIGYMPQDVELFSGSIAENIARFIPNADPNAVIRAAQAAGVHELILSFPEGYSTQIGEAGHFLSAGQRQRVALARALYGDPFLVVLDEPNSNLDAQGEAALTHAIHTVRGRGGIAVIVAHRPSALAGVDMVLMMNQGRAQAFGPRDEVLRQVLQPAAQGATHLRAVRDS
jgi:ATP-binding cassette subfamily C protein